MNLLSIQIGKPQSIKYKNRDVLTSFYKKSISSPILVRTLGLEGDTQSDLRVHGG